MPDPESTCWTVIRDAAAGEPGARAAFAQRYEPIVRAYLGARWRGTPLLPEIDDAAQTVFLDCFREHGALTRADSQVSGGFRSFLFGVARNVARRVEKARYGARERQADSRFDLAAIEARDEPLSRVFDRAWALALLREAADLMAERAVAASESARRRVDLLRLRVVEGRPIRDIARDWDEEPERLHYHYKRARTEFKAALREVVRGHEPEGAVDAECARLLEHVR